MAFDCRRVQGDETFIARDASAHRCGEQRAQLHLSKAGGMAVGHDREIGGHVLDQRPHDPQVVSVHDLGSKVFDGSSELISEGRTVELELLGGHGREARAGVRHHVTHARHRERELVRAEVHSVDLVWRESADKDFAIIDRDTDDRPLLPAAGFGFAHERVECDSAASARGSL